MNRYLKKNNYTNSSIAEDGASLTVNITETKVQPATFYYHFDNNNKCSWMQISSNCDSCLRKERNIVLTKKTAGWKKIAEDKWVSR